MRTRDTYRFEIRFALDGIHLANACESMLGGYSTYEPEWAMCGFWTVGSLIRFKVTTAPSTRQDKGDKGDGGSSIRVLPAEAAVRQKRHLAQDVVAKTPAAQRQPVLAVAGCHTFDLFDMVPPLIWCRLVRP
jgi:hypothetical protein